VLKHEDGPGDTPDPGARRTPRAAESVSVPWLTVICFRHRGPVPGYVPEDTAAGTVQTAPRSAPDTSAAYLAMAPLV